MTKWYDHTFLKAARIVCYHRSWFHREVGSHLLHPSVQRLLGDDHRPRNWHQLLLEWPHVAQSDRARLAYTRDERAGEENRQTLTSVGKYLNRHFDLPDHVIRDAVAQYIGGTDTYKILRTVDEMVHAVNNGPHSCMCWSQRDFLRCSDGEYRHPYAAYDPEYGWHMAVRVSPSGEIVGRALLNTYYGENYWVRSFGKQEGSSYSYTDEKLEVWLKDQGYVRHHSWHDSAQLAHIPTRYGFLAPYLDGDTRNATLTYKDELYIDEDGDYELRNTDGTAEQQGRFTCPDCGARCDEEDIQCVGYNGDHTVCSDCCSNDYTYVHGRRGGEYYVPNDDAVEVDGDWYDCNYLEDNNIVELANGDYTHSDNAVRCDDDDEWYHVDDPDMIFCEYDDKYHHIDNCVDTEDEGWVHGDDAWQCYASDKYYSDNTDHVLIDGCMYHPDHAPEQEETETNTQE
jgi:hypothetical protein